METRVEVQIVRESCISCEKFNELIHSKVIDSLSVSDIVWLRWSMEIPPSHKHLFCYDGISVKLPKSAGVHHPEVNRRK